MLRKIENLEELAGLKIVSITEMSFMHSSRFENEKEAINSYDAVQQILRDQDGDLGISAYRLLQNWQEEPPSNKPWFVIVLGETPPGPVATQLVEIINQGGNSTYSRRSDSEARKNTLGQYGKASRCQ